MNVVAGVLLVRRIRWWAEARAKKPHQPALSLSEDQIVRRYRGVDGKPWPEELGLTLPLGSGLAEIRYWGDVSTIAAARTNETIYDAIILSTADVLPDQPPAVDFLGFDFGFYNDEYSVYSSIFHEVIHGPLPELRRYATALNSSLLFPSVAAVENYRQIRDDLGNEGRDIERSDCYAIAVFGTRTHVEIPTGTRS